MTNPPRPVYRWMKFLIPLLLLPVGVAGCRRGPAVPLQGEATVPLLVLQAEDGATMAFAPVYINGEGPFAFALDTGASHSAVDETLADQLGLSTAGPNVDVTGVSATAEARQVDVNQWRVGDVDMSGRIMVTLKLPEANRRLKMRGLLGSDVLSTFGAVRVDYGNQRLTLGAAP